MRALGFEPKKEEIRKMISDIDKDGSGKSLSVNLALERYMASILHIKDYITLYSPHQRLLYYISFHSLH